MNALTLHFALWGILALMVLALAVYRKLVSQTEDDHLHISDREVGALIQQKNLAQRLDLIDRWGKISTLLALLYGLAIAAYYAYQTWLESARLPGL